MLRSSWMQLLDAMRGQDEDFDMTGPPAPAGRAPRREVPDPNEMAARLGALRSRRARPADEQALRRLLAVQLDPERFDSVDADRTYQPGVATNTTDNRRRGRVYATYVKDGNVYHEYVINGRRRSVLVGPADRRLS